MDDLSQTASFWDAEHAEAQFRTWMEHPLIRSAINRRVGGEAEMWPLDWLEAWSAGRTYRRALSIGCGTGGLERDLLRRRLCGSIDAIDVSIQSVAQARRTALLEGFGDSINYFVGDFNRLSLPPAHYELVLFHQSLHHVDELEATLSTVMQALTPDGLLYLDEYVGPSRTSWSPRRFAPVRFVYDRLPPSVRAHDKLLLPIHPYDPSEAIRSGEIISRTAIGFVTLEERPYGGNLLAPIYGSLTERPDEIISGLIEQEEAWLAEHGSSHYRIIVARPQQGLGQQKARLIYGILGALHAAGLAKASHRARAFARRVFVAIDRRLRRKPIDHYW